MGSQFKFGDYVLDIERKKLLNGGKMIGLSPKAVELLALLVEHRGEVVTREELMDRLWGDVNVEDGNISFQISCLRKVLGQNGTLESQYIRTIPKKGYSFIAEVTAVPEFSANRPRRSVLARWAVAGILPILVGGAVLSIASALWQPSDGRGGSAAATDDFSRREAQAFYVKARRVWESRVFSEQNPSELLLQAIERDPGFVEARILLADTYAFDATPARVETALADARALTGETGSILATEGFVRMFHYWDWQGARNAFERSIELDPRDAKARHWYGVFLALSGDLKNARRQLETAAELKPESLIIASDRAQLDYFEGYLDEAARRLEAVLKIEPRFSMARRYLADVREAQGLEAEAFEHEMSAVVRDSESIAQKREIFLRSGLRGLWLESTNPTRCNSDPYGCASTYAKLDDRENTIAFLRLALDKRAFEVPFAAVDPVFGDMRDDPAFTSLISQIRHGG